jgi:predicted small metal-binding protein
MMYRFSCKDMGLNCLYVVKCETVEEAVQKALQHVRETHAADFNLIQSPAQILEMEKALKRSMRVVSA